MSEPVLTDPPDIGDVIAERYRLEALIGQGGMARVFRATDTVLGRQVAVKLFRDGAGESGDGERARTETTLLASLSHPALVTLHDAHISDSGLSFLVMELIAGQTLREQIARGPIPTREVAAAAADLAEALHTVHSAGIVHRDIKPSNVLTPASAIPGRAFRVKLADFGIAYLIDTTRLTTPGTLIGTAAYLAPEQVRGDPITPATDVYALGLLLLEALTGERAYPHASGPGAVMARLVSPPTIPETLPPAWRDLLTAMTATEPAERPTALEVAVAATALPHVDRDTDLETVALAPPLPPALPPRPTVPAADATRATPPPLPTVPPEDATRATAVMPAPATTAPVAAPKRRRRLLAAGVGAGVLVVLGASGIALATATAPEPARSLPAVGDPLDTHLQQLLEEVTP